MPSFPCGKTSPSPTPTGRPFPFNPGNYTLGNIIIPIPIYRPVSVGGDVKVTTNIEYRIPIAGPVSFAIFDDFDITSVIRQSQLRQSVEGADQLNSPLYGCTSYFNGACQGGQSIQFINVIRPISRHQLGAAHLCRRRKSLPCCPS